MVAPNQGDPQNHRPFSPIRAHTRTAHSELTPIAYDCVKIIVIRAGGDCLINGGSGLA